MANCGFCGGVGGLHTNKCPVNPANPPTPNHQVPIIGQQAPQVERSKKLHCPVCGYRPFAPKSNPDVVIVETVLPIPAPDDSTEQNTILKLRCPNCWNRAVARLTPLLVPIEEVTDEAREG